MARPRVEEVHMAQAKLAYVIKFVRDMNKAVEFYRDVVGLTLRFESPGWTESRRGIRVWLCIRHPRVTRLVLWSWPSRSRMSRRSIERRA